MKTRIYNAGPASGETVRRLELAFQRELPAFWVGHFELGCFSTRIVVATDDSTPDYAFARIEGFSVPGLTLAEVK